MKFLVTLLLTAVVTIGAWTLKEVVSLKVAVAEIKRDVTHLAARTPAASGPPRLTRLEDLSLEQLTELEVRNQKSEIRNQKETL